MTARTSPMERLRAIDDADLDVYEFRLYMHIWRVGVSWENQRTMAKKCNMSLGKVNQARQSLLDKSLLTYERKDGRLGLAAVLCSQDEQTQQYHVADVHDVNTDVHDVNTDVHVVNTDVHVVNAILSKPLEDMPIEVSNLKGEKIAPARAAVAPVVISGAVDRTPAGFRRVNGYHPPADEPIPDGDEPGMVKAAPAAVRLIWRITGNWPAADLHDWLAAEMGDAPDEDTFRRVYLAWRARGYKATNYEGLAEWYKAALATPNWQPPAQGRGNLRNDPDAREAHNRAVLGQVAQELSGGEWTPWIVPST